MELDHGNTITNDCETFLPNFAAMSSFIFVTTVKSNIHCFPHRRQPSANSPSKKSVDSSVVGSANCVACQTLPRTLPRQKKVPPDIAVNAKTPSGNFASVLTTHLNAIMKGGASHNERHVTRMGLTQPLHQEKAPPDIYVSADSVLEKFAMRLTTHFDVTMTGGDLPKGRSQPRALHAGIHKTGPDMISADTCFWRKTDSGGKNSTIHLKPPVHTASTVAIYNADGNFPFRLTQKRTLKLWKSGNRIDALQKCQRTKFTAAPNARFGWNCAVRILEGVSSPPLTKTESQRRHLGILLPESYGTMGQSSSRTGISSCTWRPAAGTSTMIPKFSERVRCCNCSIVDVCYTVDCFTINCST